MKQLAFFMNPSCLSWKIISSSSDQIFNANHLIFTGYGISTLVCMKIYSLRCKLDPLEFIGNVKVQVGGFYSHLCQKN